jgi:ADP-ribose pyrophosphatase YjhB (NUDIX family)
MTMANQRHSVSVSGVVVDDDGRVLLTKRADNGEWQAPGGILELNEGIHEGLRREVLEETGLIVQPEGLTGVYKNIPRGVVALVFRCKATGGTLQPTDEVSSVYWAEPSEVSTMVTEVFAIRICDALKEGQPAIRQHDGVNLM